MKFIYHITHIDNFEKILDYGSIICKNILDEEISDYVKIAYEGIQKRRHRTKVPISPGGNLHDYVPFHFAPRAPMLYTLYHGNVASFHDGQEKLIYLMVKIKDIVDSKIKFVYSDGHPIVIPTNFFNDLNLLGDVIDWPLMKNRYWHNTSQDTDRKRRRQAEFLVYKRLPLKLISEIAVYNKTIKKKVDYLLEKYHLNIKCIIKKNWYY